MTDKMPGKEAAGIESVTLASSTLTLNPWDEDDRLPRPVGPVDLEVKAKELGIEFFVLMFSSLACDQRVLLVPRSAIRRAQTNGCNFHGGTDYGSDGLDPECYMVPDGGAMMQLPWKPELAWVPCFVYMKGRPLPHCPRRLLLRQIERAKKHGLVLKTGIEPEFILLRKDSLEEFNITDKTDFQTPQLMRAGDFLMKVTKAMDQLGWGPYKIEHESRANQYEIGFNYADALTMADRWSFFKFMIKMMADEEGLRVSFMPTTFNDPGPMQYANGLHIHHSLWSVQEDKELFPDPEGHMGLSDVARQFLAGLMLHMNPMTAIYCSTVNSYKRLTWSPHVMNILAYGVDSRWPSVRIVTDNGRSNRFEFRAPDAAANPYLAHAAILASGLDGIEKTLTPDPKQRLQKELIEGLPPEEQGLEIMPKTLEEALKLLQGDELSKEVLGEEGLKHYINLKMEQWNSFMRVVTPWELDYLDQY